MDFVKDQNPRPVYLADELVGLPEYVKSASELQPEELDALAVVSFASPAQREYPIHTKAATWLSAAYALGTFTEVPGYLQGRIKAAAEFHGISEDYEKLVAAFQNFNKKASEPTLSFALTVDFGEAGGNLGIQNFYPLNDEYDIVKSARVMLKDADEGRLPINYFRLAAKEVIKAAAAKSIPFDEFHPRIRAIGEDRFPDFEHALTCVGLRKSAGVDEEAVELYKAAALGARDEPEKIDQWLDIWLDLDATCGIKYAAAQPNPYEAFFAGDVMPDAEKVASEAVLVSSVMIPKSVLSGISEDVVRQNFKQATADVIVDAVKQAAEHPEIASGLLDTVDAENQAELLRVLLRAA